ncbi:hypothetical protein AVEN_42885-1 [Araneus ventricosus]|uniref:Uncharacterized protein n=1 Tax=Araneus ventricosus TaxID=182803 RepID=A0A4Y2AHC1_ARAVE|nr:hypothetical protein AVEN_42885-1 [Araneus ventricosus]
MTRTTLELAPPSPSFHATPTGGRLTPTYDLACNRPHTRRIFSGIGSRTWSPPAPKPRPYHEATAASATESVKEIEWSIPYTKRSSITA